MGEGTADGAGEPAEHCARGVVGHVEASQGIECYSCYKPHTSGRNAQRRRFGLIRQSLASSVTPLQVLQLN
jgi:hypothetical protein